jgi:hypothetical protein
VYVEACLAIIIAGSAWRVWYARKKHERELDRIQVAFHERVKSKGQAMN